MSIMAKQGVCPHCGHDHRNPNKPMIPPVFKELSDTKQQLATAERLLAESQARDKHSLEMLARARDIIDTLPGYPKGADLCDEIDTLIIVSEANPLTALDAALKESYELGRQQMQLSCDMERDAAIAKAKREVLLEASNRAVEEQWLGAACVDGLRRMADELKGGEQ